MYSEKLEATLEHNDFHRSKITQEFPGDQVILICDWSLVQNTELWLVIDQNTDLWLVQDQGAPMVITENGRPTLMGIFLRQVISSQANVT